MLRSSSSLCFQLVHPNWTFVSTCLLLVACYSSSSDNVSGAQAGAGEIRLGWVMLDLTAVKRTNVACASLAVEAANARNGAVSSSLTALRHNFTFTLHGIVAGNSRRQWVHQLKTFVEAESIDVLLMDATSSYAVQVADLVNEKGIPALLIGATSPVFENRPRKQWWQYFRMKPTTGKILPQLTDLMVQAGWTHMAVVFAPSDTWSSTMADLVRTRAGGQFNLSFYPLSSIGEKPLAMTVNKIKRSGVKIVLSLLWMGYLQLEEILLDAEMMGPHPNAKGYAYLTVERYLSQSDFDSGALNGAILFNSDPIFNERPWNALRDEWSLKMPEKVLELPAGVRISAEERVSLSKESIKSGCYDSIVALAVAADKVLERRSLPVKSWRYALSNQLADGVVLDSLGPYSQFSGSPWASPEIADRLLNVQKRNGPVAIEHVFDAVFPGRNSEVPVSFVPTPCSDVDCGWHGECVVQSATGRSPGWCKCNQGFAGRTCAEQVVMRDTPGHATIEVSIDEIVLLAFGQASNRYSIEVHMRSRFADPRVVLEGGQYKTGIASLVGEERLWLPSFHISELISPTTSSSMTITCSRSQECHNIDLKTKIAGEAEIIVTWSLYPFDEHDVNFHIEMPADITWLPPADLQGLWNDLKGDLRWSVQMHQISHQNRALDIKMTVQRGKPYIFIRWVIPSIILVAVSWAGFFIKPTILMPRFAAGFISFLAMTAFLKNARDEMPRNCPLTCFDVYLSCIGIIMALAVLENVTAQFIFEAYSESLAKHLDLRARRVFPTMFLLVLVMLAGMRHYVFPALITTHSMLVISLVVVIFRVRKEANEFPMHILRRCVHLNAKYKSRAVHDPKISRLPWVNPTEKELGSIFSAIDNDNSGTLHIDEIEQWVVKCMHPKLSELEISRLKSALARKFDDDEVAPEQFKEAFKSVMMVIADVVNHHGATLNDPVVDEEEHEADLTPPPLKQLSQNSFDSGNRILQDLVTIPTKQPSQHSIVPARWNNERLIQL